MVDYEVAPEVVRVALVFGVIVSILFYERVQLTTGGAIVPAYLALSVTRPLAIVMTLVAAYASYFGVNSVISRRKVLYGRRKFEIELLIGLAVILVSTLLASFAGHLDPVLLGLSGIGFLVPGIIAHDMGRQQPVRTMKALAATTALLAVFVFVYESVLEISPVAPRHDSVQLAGVLGYPRELIIYAVVLSVLLGMFLFARLGVRSGGFITGAYLALVSPRWADLLFVAFVATLTWFVVVKGLMPRLLLFGRRKLSAMVLVGAAIGWLTEIMLTTLTHGDYVPWRGLTVATLMVPCLIANDIQRQGFEKTAFGTVLSGVGVFAGMNLTAAAAMAMGLL